MQKNPHYIQRSFKEQMGMTPLKYLHQIRMDQAKALLKNKDWSITDIALEVGYSNSSHFSIKFKESLGVTPTKFRTSFLK